MRNFATLYITTREKSLFQQLMRARIQYIILTILMLCATMAHAQERSTEIIIDFRVNSTTVDSSYSDNAIRLQEIMDFLQKIDEDSTVTITSVSFCGSASPEGSYQLNHKLARGRLSALEKIVKEKISIPDSIITYDESYISWGILREQVVASDIDNKQLILDVIDQEPRLVDYPGGRHIDHRIAKLQSLAGGKVWKQLYKLYFERMRYACVIFVTDKKRVIAPIAIPVQKEETDSVVSAPQEEPEEVKEKWVHGLHVKTNAIGLGMAISNLAVEVDIAKHWSFALPAYYAAHNYFVPTIKFRTLGIQPELRYWFNEDNHKFFVGAHFGVASYNIAVDGDLRYQDHDGKKPALGGGLGFGYRMPISKNNRWHIDFAIGAGVYSLYYDTFHNVENGKFIDSYKKTYWGLDNAAINISYRFNLKRRNR